MAEILIPISLFLSVFGILYVFFTTRNKERLAMIEKGADPAIFKSQYSFRRASVRLGMFLIGVALGILMGNILESYTALAEEVSYFSMIFLFAGLSLVLYYILMEKNKKDE
jgi:uncharacterized protein DUF6249